MPVSTPARLRARARPVTASPRPPLLARGKASEVTIKLLVLAMIAPVRACCPPGQGRVPGGLTQAAYLGWPACNRHAWAWSKGRAARALQGWREASVVALCG